MASQSFSIMAAPLQGLTEAPFRHFHAEIYGTGHMTYFTPFVRLEKGEPRSRDMRDVTSALNANHDVTPQIIARDADEFATLVDAVTAAGYDKVDLNVGCPFPPQVRKGRGAGLLNHPDRLNAICDVMLSSHIKFSLKMRLGINAPDEYIALLPIINRMSLTHLTVHPRTASQQYSGSLHINHFSHLLSTTHHPVIFNGDLTTPADIDYLIEQEPTIAGFMLGRGLLRRPSLVAEWIEGSEWSQEKRIAKLTQLHDSIFKYYKSILCGDTQILSKIMPLWEYWGHDFDRKAIKKVLKSHSLEAYANAVGTLRVQSTSCE